MTTARRKVTCYLCRRRRPPGKMNGSRCADEAGCQRAMVNWITADALTPAERAAKRQAREDLAR